MNIETAIKQPKFKTAAQRAVVNLLYTASWLQGELRSELLTFDISVQQFNILRILRGQKGKPASLKLLTERMLDKTSNTSRLIDKLVQKACVKRIACPDDRRKVEITLTDLGLRTVNQAAHIVDQKTEQMTAHMSSDQLIQMSGLLDAIRSDSSS